MPPDAGRTASRKAEHLRINLEEDVQSTVSAGFDAWRFVPLSMPELALAEVDLRTVLFGRELGAPLLVSCMTGGTAAAAGLNRVLASVAQRARIALGLGSARVLLEDPTATAGFDVRAVAPDVPLLANLGAVQLTRGIDASACLRLVETLGADALVLHLNALQEGLQPGGDADFRGVLGRIGELCIALPVPVVVKEVGWGIPPDDVVRLVDAGVAAVDVAGAGGTSWSEVEGRRGDSRTAATAAAFRGWGLPTAEAVRRAREACPDALLIASGGVRDGLEVAKAIALGADIVGIAGPFLRAAAQGEAAAHAMADAIVDVLRLVMFCTGSESVAGLRGSARLERCG